jgi:hypothetical protein
MCERGALGRRDGKEALEGSVNTGRHATHTSPSSFGSSCIFAPSCHIMGVLLECAVNPTDSDLALNTSLTEIMFISRPIFLRRILAGHSYKSMVETRRISSANFIALLSGSSLKNTSFREKYTRIYLVNERSSSHRKDAKRISYFSLTNLLKSV